MPARRAPTFDTLGAAVRDAEHLLAAGYESAGKWDLAQVCNHLADWLRFPMDGFPTPPLFLRPMFWVMRNTIGPGELRRLIAGKPFPLGSPTAPQTVYRAGGDPAAAVARFADTVRRAEAYTGELRPSPFFGRLTREEWFGLNRAHFAHHLSFLVPKS